MALTQCVRDFEDRSDDGGYRFRFRCDQCHGGYDTQYVAATPNLWNTAVQVVSIFTTIGSGARRAVNDLERGLRGKDHDAAYERAVQEAMAYFKHCAGCGHWVCPEQCWNESLGKCRGCAPDAREASG